MGFIGNRTADIRLCLPGLNLRQPISRRGWRLTRRLLSPLQQLNAVLSPITASPATVADYPWCFVMRDKQALGQRFLVGAIIPSDPQPRMVAYLWVTESWLQSELHQPHNLLFWLSRTLAMPLQCHTSCSELELLQKQCALLQRSQLPRWYQRWPVSKATVNQQLEQLQAAYCFADTQWQTTDGVEVMPWQAWPRCIGQGDAIWLWRQSRHAKIIEANKFPF